MIFLDDVYAEKSYGKTRFHQIKAPTKNELNVLAHRICQRVTVLYGCAGTANYLPHNCRFAAMRKGFTLQIIAPIGRPRG